MATSFGQETAAEPYSTTSRFSGTGVSNSSCAAPPDGQERGVLPLHRMVKCGRHHDLEIHHEQANDWQGARAARGVRACLAPGPRAWPLWSAIAAAAALTSACGGDDDDDAAARQAALVAQGKEIFRFDTFGDEAKWTDTLRLHEAVRSAVDPTTALAVGLKVDAEALPAAVVAGIQNGSISLTSPATTVALLKLNAVVGLKGTVETVNGQDTLTRLGVTCALCHSTVDNSFAPGIGKRLDGWPNRDLNPGAIIALSPALDAAAKPVFSSWGKGKYDPRFNIDGLSKPAVIPPAYGLDGLHSVTSPATATNSPTGTATSPSRRWVARARCANRG